MDKLDSGLNSLPLSPTWFTSMRPMSTLLAQFTSRTHTLSPTCGAHDSAIGSVISHAALLRGLGTLSRTRAVFAPLPCGSTGRPVFSPSSRAPWPNSAQQSAGSRPPFVGSNLARLLGCFGLHRGYKSLGLSPWIPCRGHGSRTGRANRESERREKREIDRWLSNRTGRDLLAFMWHQAHSRRRAQAAEWPGRARFLAGVRFPTSGRCAMRAAPPMHRPWVSAPLADSLYPLEPVGPCGSVWALCVCLPLLTRDPLSVDRRNSSIALFSSPLRAICTYWVSHDLSHRLGPIVDWLKHHPEVWPRRQWHHRGAKRRRRAQRRVGRGKKYLAMDLPTDGPD
jgi:hypothetical protein